MSETCKTCETCHFWKKRENADIHGECRRYPPSPNTGPIDYDHDEITWVWWPITETGHWCGEWKEREL